MFHVYQHFEVELVFVSVGVNVKLGLLKMKLMV